MPPTVFLDAGGVLVWPNWSRISSVLAEHGVDIAPERLAAADPYARRTLDTAEIITASSDQGRGWKYFDLVLTHAGVQLSDATDRGLNALHEYHSTSNL